MKHLIMPLLPALIVLWAVAAPAAADCPQPDLAAMDYAPLAGSARASDHMPAVDLNRMGIMYARGRGVAKNPRLASRLFRQLALDGYTPAMVNLGTMYEQGMTGRRDHRLAYAWIRAALALGVPAQDYDETLFKLGMIAGRLGAGRMAGAENLAVSIADAIAGTMAFGCPEACAAP